MEFNWKNRYARYREIFLNLSVVYRKRPDVRMFLEIILSLLTTSFFIIAAIKPTLTTISTLVIQNKSKQELVEIMDTKIQNLSTARQNYDAEKARLDILLSAIPDFPKPETFIKQVELLAASTNVNLTNFSISETTLVADTVTSQPETNMLNSSDSTFSFSINLSGDYQSLTKFLGNLELLRRPVKIESVSLSSTQDQMVKSILLTVTGKVSYLGVTNQ